MQGELEAALARVLRLPSGPVDLRRPHRRRGARPRARSSTSTCRRTLLAAAAGRAADAAADALLRRLNGVLPADVRVRRVVEAPDGFDARFSALWRRYAYRVADDPAAGRPAARGARAGLAAAAGRATR